MGMVDWVMENRSGINTVFQMKDHGDGVGNYEKTVKLIQKVLRRWCMSELKPLTKDTKKKTLEYKIYISNPTLAIVYENLK